MKKTIISILAAAVTMTACDLNKMPLSQLSPNTFFSTEAELEAYMEELSLRGGVRSPD